MYSGSRTSPQGVTGTHSTTVFVVQIPYVCDIRGQREWSQVFLSARRSFSLQDDLLFCCAAAAHYGLVEWRGITRQGRRLIIRNFTVAQLNLMQIRFWFKPGEEEEVSERERQQELEQCWSAGNNAHIWLSKREKVGEKKTSLLLQHHSMSSWCLNQVDKHRWFMVYGTIANVTSQSTLNSLRKSGSIIPTYANFARELVGESSRLTLQMF